MVDEMLTHFDGFPQITGTMGKVLQSMDLEKISETMEKFEKVPRRALPPIRDAAVVMEQSELMSLKLFDAGVRKHRPHGQHCHKVCVCVCVLVRSHFMQSVAFLNG
jgi:hypothetical protein